jgi:putative DNA methylase
MAIAALPASVPSVAVQADAALQTISTDKVVSTDPPYYDNISYADLSDFFYVWLRRSLKPIFPDLFATLAVPKEQELIAASYRHGGKGNAGVLGTYIRRSKSRLKWLRRARISSRSWARS